MIVKCCSKCKADVEGLLYCCDLCGAPLQTEKERFFKRGTYKAPQWLEFPKSCYEMLDAIQPADPEKYSDFLEEVLVSMVCHPGAVLADHNIHDRLIYYPKKKYANMTITVDMDDFVYADREEKASQIADAILRGIYMLQDRMRKYQRDIDDIVIQAETALGKYRIADER